MGSVANKYNTVRMNAVRKRKEKKKNTRETLLGLMNETRLRRSCLRLNEA